MSPLEHLYTKAYRVFEYLHNEPTDTHFLGLLYNSDISFKDFQEQLNHVSIVTNEQDLLKVLVDITPSEDSEQKFRDAYQQIETYVFKECQVDLSKKLKELEEKATLEKGRKLVDLYSNTRKISYVGGFFLLVRGASAFMLGLLFALLTLTDFQFYLSHALYDAPYLDNPPVPVQVQVTDNIYHYQDKRNINRNVIECRIQYNVGGVIYKQSNISRIPHQYEISHEATFPQGRPDLATIKGTKLVDDGEASRLSFCFLFISLLLAIILLTRVKFLVGLKNGRYALHKLEKAPEKMVDESTYLTDLFFPSANPTIYKYKTVEIYPEDNSEPIEWHGETIEEISEIKNHVIVQKFLNKTTPVSKFPMNLKPEGADFFQFTPMNTLVIETLSYCFLGFVSYPVFVWALYNS